VWRDHVTLFVVVDGSFIRVRHCVFASNPHHRHLNNLDMSLAIPFAFPYNGPLRQSMTAALNFDGAIQRVRAASDTELAQMTRTREMEEIVDWLEQAKALKVSEG
jgi:hypothetical protein